MNILMCTDAMGYGGAETHIISLSKELIRLGHRVSVASPAGELVSTLEAVGVRHIPLPPLKKTPSSLTAWQRRLKRAVKHGHFDVIHAHARLPARLARPIAKKYKAAFVVTAHAMFRMSFWRRRLSVWGDRTIAVSEDIRRHIIKSCHVKPARVRVISNGIDTEHFSPPENSGADRPLRVIFVSRLDDDCSRAARLLCRLSGRLTASFPDIQILIVGGGTAYGEISVLAELMNTACGREIIQMCGARGDVAPLLRQSDVFVGVSRAALEAAACGLPVILAGDEGYGGIFVPGGGVEATNLCARGGAETQAEPLFADICSLLALPADKKRQIGAAARRYVIENYSALAAAEQTLEVYRAAKRV
ncbi:MAG: glycosyltransferase family 4 protein [Clostridia bacterium]|nr:glycosyltransferase family 4 protein [Clostridia bacterium]